MHFLKSNNNNLKYSGVKRNRTADLFNAIEALYQLSYNPVGYITYYDRLF